jgi:hypothetical protein
MPKLTSEESFITKVERFLKKKGYIAVDMYGQKLSMKELESAHEFYILTEKPSETESGIDSPQPEFLAEINLSKELIYWDQSNKDETYALAEEICETFGVHVSVFLAPKKVNN